MPAGCCRSRALAGVVVLAATVTVSACSNTEPAVNRRPLTGTATATPVGGVQQVTIKAGDEYRFNPSTIIVHPGKVRIVLVHTGTGAPHDWQLSGFPADFVPLTPGGQRRSAEFVAPSPGRYQFVCTIHARQGQRGTMIVRAG
jgi:plastocyanin